MSNVIFLSDIESMTLNLILDQNILTLKSKGGKTQIITDNTLEVYNSILEKLDTNIKTIEVKFKEV